MSTSQCNPSGMENGEVCIPWCLGDAGGIDDTEETMLDKEP